MTDADVVRRLLRLVDDIKRSHPREAGALCVFAGSICAGDPWRPRMIAAIRAESDAFLAHASTHGETIQ